MGVFSSSSGSSLDFKFSPFGCNRDDAEQHNGEINQMILFVLLKVEFANLYMYHIIHGQSASLKLCF